MSYGIYQRCIALLFYFSSSSIESGEHNVAMGGDEDGNT